MVKKNEKVKGAIQLSAGHPCFMLLPIFPNSEESRVDSYQVHFSVGKNAGDWSFLLHVDLFMNACGKRVVYKLLLKQHQSPQNLKWYSSNSKPVLYLQSINRTALVKLFQSLLLQQTQFRCRKCAHSFLLSKRSQGKETKLLCWTS